MREIGKTRFCANLVQYAREKGLRVEGVLCPPGFEGNQKTSIQLESLRSGEKVTLARVREEGKEGLTTDHWIFDPTAMEWGNRLLGEVQTCDLLIVDELGPLEFERGQGWLNGFTALDQGDFKIAVVVIRSELLDQAIRRWPDAKTITIPVGLEPGEEIQLQMQILSL
jgi:nucleoside-triphosphatase THEP1